MKKPIIIKTLDLSRFNQQQFECGLSKTFLHIIKFQNNSLDLIKKIFRELLISFILLKKREVSIIIPYIQDIKYLNVLDNSVSLTQNIIITVSLQVLARELNLIQKSCIPFWNSQLTEISNNFWIPSKVDLIDSNLNILNNLTLENEENSLYWSKSIQNPNNLPKPLCELSPSLIPVKANKSDFKTLKIRIQPTKEQKKILNNWNDTHRYLYNKVLSHIKEHKEYVFEPLRDLFVSYNTKSGINQNVKLWELETPKEVRASAIRELCSAFKGAFTNLKNKNINSFNMSFRKKKDKKFCFGIEHSAIKIINGQVEIYSSYFDKKKINPGIRVGKRSPKNFNVEHDSKVYCKNGKYYLLIAIPNYTRQFPKTHNTIALDPGVRTFQTGYSTSEVVSFRRDSILIDKLKKKIATLQKYKSNKYIQKHYDRISNITDNLHYQTINNLTNNYYNVLLPSFESQEMIGNLGKSTRFNLNSLKHYQFKQRLIFKGNSSNTNVFIVNESYTSKTCGRCGVLNNKLGSSKIFKCNSCNLIIDRDFNGARNILLKHLCSGHVHPA